MAYSSKAILDWFHRTLGVDHQPNPDEVNTDCPKCGEKKLYFYIKKQIGKCHKASCVWHAKVFLKDLIEVVGFAPHQGGEWEPKVEEKAPVTVTLPGYPVLIWTQNQLMTSNETALKYLRGRGLDDKLILNWKITCDGERIYVPIFHAGVLVNFNSRILPGFDLGDGGRKKYLYCKGVSTGKYILGWEECRDWTDLAIVENTFVSLAYRYRMHCSTTFGSNVSDAQAKLIAESSVRRVAILWDENAWAGADRAIKKLQAFGVKAAYWKILGQPDDYPIEWVEAKWKLVMAAAEDGVAFIDFREECAKIREKQSSW